ncbi:MAG: amidohydrolase family protein [Acidimicrobiia bacterium]
MGSPTSADGVISATSHLEVSPDEWRSYVDAEFQRFVPQVTTVDGRAAWVMPVTDEIVPLPSNLFLSADGARAGTIAYDAGLPGTGDAAQRLRELDDDGITAEVLLPPFFGRRALPRLPGDASIAVCRGYNDWLHEYTAAEPQRLVGVGMLPAATLQDSCDELHRVAEMAGVRGVQLSQWPNGSGAPAPDDDRFWADAISTRVALVAHRDFGGGALEDPTRVPAHFFTISFLTTKGGAPYSASQLFATGVLERFPELRVFYVHGSIAWVEYWGEQADDHYMRHRYWAESELPHPPSHYFKSNLCFDFTVDPVGLEIRDMLNLDNIMWGRAFPTSHGTWPHTADAVEAQFVKADVSDDDRRKLVHGNAARIFGLA